jgi:hypothetical protein
MRHQAARVAILALAAALLAPRPLLAALGDVDPGLPASELFSSSCCSGHRDPYRSLFVAGTTAPEIRVAGVVPSPSLAQQAAVPAVAPIEYSHAYQTRLKIHKISSFAMLPLFATELILGQSLYNDGGSGKKDAHVAVGVGIGTLFGINTVTGVWNLLESRKDPNGRKRRVIHSILMLAADAGFATTAALAPDTEHGGDDSRGAHRAAAITSIGLGTAGYLMMLFTK